MDFTNFEIVLMAQAVVDVVLIAAFAYCIPKFIRYSRMARVMTAESKTVRTSKAMISLWARRRNKLKKGSPKWNAYTDRLKAVGYLSPDGRLAPKKKVVGD